MKRYREAFFNSRGQVANRQRASLKEMKAMQAGDGGQRIGLSTFKRAEEKGDWRLLHGGHFDWWMFPIDDGSRIQYNVFADDVEELLSDPQYVANYREGVRIAMKSWGWDVGTSAPVVEITGKGQGWANWDVRLAKICRSCYIFKQNDLLQSCQKFARRTKPNGGFRYGGINLDELLNFPPRE